MKELSLQELKDTEFEMLKIFDAFCKENNITTYGFALSDPENIYRVVMGEKIGTKMHN